MSSPSPVWRRPGRFPEPFGRYQLLQPLAAGGMAEVLLAEMQGPAGFLRRVALKRVLPHLAHQQEYIQAFQDEARVGGFLVHSNIVQILDFNFVDGTPYLAMEFVDGGHFGTVISYARRTSSAIPLGPLIGLFLQAVRGVQFAHQARDNQGRPLKLIHRDLKPSNMLIGMNGQVKLADFGIAKSSTNLVQTVPFTVKGSLPYMSPEQASGRGEITPVSDLFSLGAVFYEMLTLERLFWADEPMALLAQVAGGPSEERLERLGQRHLEHPGIGLIVRRLLEVDPERRYPDALGLIQAIEAIAPPMVSPEALASFCRVCLGHAEELGRVTEPPQERRGIQHLGPSWTGTASGEADVDRDEPVRADLRTVPPTTRVALKRESHPYGVDTQPDGTDGVADLPRSSSEVDTDRALSDSLEEEEVTASGDPAEAPLRVEGRVAGHGTLPVAPPTMKEPMPALALLPLFAETEEERHVFAEERHVFAETEDERHAASSARRTARRLMYPPTAPDDLPDLGLMELALRSDDAALDDQASGTGITTHVRSKKRAWTRAAVLLCLLLPAGVYLAVPSLTGGIAAPRVVPPTARVSVLSEPPGAEVWLEGHRVGPTPLTLSLASLGTVRIGLRRSGVPERFFEAQLKGHEQRVVEFPEGVGPASSWVVTASTLPAALVSQESR